MTDDLDSLLDQLDLLEDEDVWLLADAWRTEDEEARRRAWAHAKKAIAGADLEPELDDARRTVGRWMGASRSDFSGIEGLLGRPGDESHGRAAAAPAIIDAVAAILAGDALSADDEGVLMGPWRALQSADVLDGHEEPPDPPDAQSRA